MAKEGGARARSLAAGFGGYFVAVSLVAYFLASYIAPYDAPGYIRWILSAYVLLGSAVLVGVCAGAARRATRLDDRIDELVWEEGQALDAARQAADASVAPALRRDPAGEPTDADVEQLLLDLHELGTTAAEPALAPEPGLRATADLRFAATEIERLKKVRKSVAAWAAGPAVAAAALVGMFAMLIPASDGMLTDLWTNTFVGMAGILGLMGVAAYAAASFRGSRA